MEAGASGLPIRTSRVLDDAALDVLFRKARTHDAWLDAPIEAHLLRQLYDLVKWGPTSYNGAPVRIRFAQSEEAKRRVAQCVSRSNVNKVMAAPVTAIIGYDLRFFELLHRLGATGPGVAERFAKSPEGTEITAIRNGTLQGAYFILASRCLGLDTCPMSGFDHSEVDAAFFGGTSIRSNFLCSIGYGDTSKLAPRKPRLEFDDVCQVL